MHDLPLWIKEKNGREGLAFIGLSLSRSHKGQFMNEESVTRQTNWDFNLVQDRDYVST
jgi:hypothetical protein